MEFCFALTFKDKFLKISGIFLDDDMRLTEEKSCYFKDAASLRMNVLDIWPRLKDLKCTDFGNAELDYYL